MSLTKRLYLLPDEIPLRLGKNATQDPKPQVRMRNLRVLLASYPKHESIPSVLEEAQCDEEEDIREFAKLYAKTGELEPVGHLGLSALRAGEGDVSVREETEGQLAMAPQEEED